MSTHSKIVETTSPLDYFKFIANSEWNLLSDFIKFYPDIAAVVAEENLASVEGYIDSLIKIDKSAKLGYGLLHIVCRVADRLSISNRLNGVIKSIFPRNQISVNSKKEDGWTALMLSARNSGTHSNFETVKLLIESGANLDIQNKNGYTSVMLAARYSEDELDIETVKLLVDAGANLKLTNKIGQTFLDLVSPSSSTAGKISKIVVEIANKKQPVKLNTEPTTSLQLVDWVAIAARTTSLEHFDKCIPEAFQSAEVYGAAIVAIGNSKS